MKIGLISESPTVATGFGTQARHLVRLFAELGHQTVVFGVCAEGIPFDPANYPCQIRPMPRDQQDALPHLAAFLRDEHPDLLFVHYDIGAAQRFIVAARAAGWAGPTVCHIVIDGLPLKRELIDLLKTVDGVITPTHHAAQFCHSVGIPNVIAAPHPIDPTTFVALPNRADLRIAAGLHEHFVVGVFGRNTERKQQPRVMMALQQLVQQQRDTGIILYMHCQPTHEDPWFNGWNLRDVAEQLGIAGRVLFPPATFQQLHGIPYVSQGSVRDPHESPAIPPHYSYLERLNICDLVVNVPYSGAVELATLEAQLCGVPVAITNDHGAMAEVAGDGALLLEPVDVGIQPSGGLQHLVSAQTIAQAIVTVRDNPAYRAELIERGFANAQRYATFEPLRNALQRVLS